MNLNRVSDHAERREALAGMRSGNRRVDRGEDALGTMSSDGDRNARAERDRYPAVRTANKAGERGAKAVPSNWDEREAEPAARADSRTGTILLKVRG